MIIFGICSNVTAGAKKLPASVTRRQTGTYRKRIKKLPELPVSKKLEFDSKEDRRSVRLFFQDEARLGRTDTSMILPYANSECMKIFMKGFSGDFSFYSVIMAMDQVSWHSVRYKNIDNFSPLFQPAYSPDVNPAEHVWITSEKNGGFKNKTFSSLEEVEEQFIDAVNSCLTNGETIRSITEFKWMLKAI
jgi:hypothetical protein